MKIKLKMKQYTSMTTDSGQLSKDLRLVPDFDSIRVTREDIQKSTDFAVAALGKRVFKKRRW